MKSAMNARATFLIAILVTASLATTLEAGPRAPKSGKERLRQRATNQLTAQEGLEFATPLIADCMSRIRNGQGEASLAELEKECQRAVGAESAELKLGLAMTYFRIGRRAQSNTVLKGVLALRDAGSLGRRAGILQRASKATAPKQSEDLVASEAWAALLSAVGRDLAKEIDAEFLKCNSALQKNDWPTLNARAASARELVETAREIKVAGVPEEALSRQIEGLSKTIRAFNAGFDKGRARAQELRQQSRYFNRRKKGLPGGRNPNANAKFEYNALVDQLRAAWEAAQPLDEELQSLLAESGERRPRRADRLIPESRLPPHEP